MNAEEARLSRIENCLRQLRTIDRLWMKLAFRARLSFWRTKYSSQRWIIPQIGVMNHVTKVRLFRKI